MKLKSIHTVLAIAAIVAVSFTACKKENTVVTENTMKYQEQAMIDDADNNYMTENYVEGDESTEFYAENDGLPEVYTLEEIDMDNSGFKRGVEKRFLACLRKLNLSDTQVMQLRKLFRSYEDCKSADIKRHREAYAKLLMRIESARKDLLAQLRAGKITKAEFEKGLIALRHDFKQSLAKIKASYRQTLKVCYDKFIRGMRHILSDRQWKAFVDCYR